MIREVLVDSIFKYRRIDVVEEIEVGGSIHSRSDQPFVLRRVVVAGHAVHVEVHHGAMVAGMYIFLPVVGLDEVIARIVEPGAEILVVVGHFCGPSFGRKCLLLESGLEQSLTCVSVGPAEVHTRSDYFGVDRLRGLRSGRCCHGSRCCCQGCDRQHC